MRRITGLSVSALAVALLAGCQSAAVKTAPNPPAATGTPGAVHGSAPAPAAAKVGDSITVTSRSDKLTVTLVKLVDPAQATNSFEKPQAGQRFVGLQFRIANAGTAAYSGDPLADVKAIDGDGQSFDASIYSTPLTAGAAMASSVNLAPGDSALGFIVVPMPTASKAVKVQYAIGFSGDVGQWKVG